MTRWLLIVPVLWLQATAVAPRYRVDQTADLVTWEMKFVGTSPTPMVIFECDSSPQRFYRIVPLL